MNHSISKLAATLVAIPPIWVLAEAVTTLLLLIFILTCVALLRSRVSTLCAQVSGRETALAKIGAELEAQALLTRQMSMDLEELRKRLLDREEMVQPVTPQWSGASAAVNLNRRGQILRLSRKGKSVPEIAQDLNVAQGEVELLLKVHDLGQKSSNHENADLSS